MFRQWRVSQFGRMALFAAGWLVAVIIAPIIASAQDSRATAISAELEVGQYDRAEALARELVSASQPRSFERLQATTLLVRALILNGYASRPETLTLSRQVLDEIEQAKGLLACCRTSATLNLADALVGAADYASAATVLRTALSRTETVALPLPDQADLLEHLATIQILVDRPEEALANATRALQFRRSAPSKPRVLAGSLFVAGWAAQRAGEYNSAGSLIREAIALHTAEGQEHPAYADAVSLLGLQIWFEGDLIEARATSERAFNLAQRHFRPGHPSIALSLKRLAVSKLMLGEAAEARALLQNALAMADAAFPPTHIDIWPYLNDLADANRAMGDYHEARNLFERGRQIAERHFGRWHDSVATSLHNLALVDASLGDFLNARNEQRQATAIWERVLGPNHPFVATALVELASVYRASGAPHLALAPLERALDIRRHRLGPSHREVAKTWTDLAATHVALGQVRAAQIAIDRALTIWKTASGPETPEVADTYRIAGTIAAAALNRSTARSLYQRSLDVLRGTVGADHPTFAQTLAELSEVLANEGQHPEAIDAASQAERTGQQHLRLMLQNLPERQALDYSAHRPRGLDTLLTEADYSTSAATQAFDALIRGRGLVLDEISARRAATTVTAAAETTGPHSRLTVARTRLANLIVRGAGTLSPSQYGRLLEGARAEAEQLEQQLASESTKFRDELSLARIGFEELRRELPDGSVLLSYVRFRNIVPGSANGEVSYLAFVQRAGWSQPSVVRLGGARAIDGLVSKWRRQLLADVGGQGPQSTTTPAISGGQLRAAVWDPLAALIQGATRVYVVPDGTLSLVPFVGLPGRNGGYLLEELPPVHYLASERDIVHYARRPAVLNAGSSLLVVGGAAFDEPEPTAHGDAREKPKSESDNRLGAGCFDLRTASFARLPGSRSEAQEIAELWRGLHPGQGTESGGSSELLLDQQASEAAFKAKAPGHRVLHLATHGFFISGDCAPQLTNSRSAGRLVPLGSRRNASAASLVPADPLMRSGLALAEANHRGRTDLKGDDGILTASEVASLNLDGTEWAVLSACDTGLGTPALGEGLLGLRRAFQIAGVRTVIMSLWPVQDDTTRNWMSHLYSDRFKDQLDTAASMRGAALKVLRDRRSRGLNTSPFYWAGFVAAGDWR